MSRRKKAGVIVGGLVVAAAVVVIALGAVGIDQTVVAGTQSKVCGVKVGVTASDHAVRLLGVSDDPLAPGDRVRAHPLCVIEIVSIDPRETAPDSDGGGTRVQLKWRLW